MKRYRQKGAITVFLSLSSVLFLSLICTLAESARVQGTRAKASAVLDMGLFSVFGEYEKSLLEDYDIFFLDGSYGSGDYHIEKPRIRLEDMMSYNITPKKGLMTGGFDPLKLTLSESSIDGITLATDEDGAPLYQQAVAYVKENLGTEAIGKLMEASAESKKQEEAQKNYQENDKNIEQNLNELRQVQEQKERELEEKKRQEELERQKEIEQGEGMVNGETNPSLQEPEVPVQAPPPPENPLDIIKKVKSMGILGLVVKDTSSISQKKIDLSELPSHRSLKKGNLKITKHNSGITSDALFQEYMLDRFPDMISQKKKGSLDYQMEYILIGKKSDQENLKGVVNRLLLLREGVNFAYAFANQEMRSETLALATLLVGVIPVPGLIPVTQTALLLAWAYGESLLDVRTLLSDGKVPLQKSAVTWKLSLQNLGKITEILQEDGSSSKEGLSYKEYLRMLLFAGSKTKYPLRTLDMIEGNVRANESTPNFRADACIAKINVSTMWQIPPLFMSVTDAFMGVKGSPYVFKVQGSFSYE